MSGYFFVFDGMDGSGKSTALHAVAKRLESLEHTVVCTREPGGSPLAERIRECMLADWDAPMPIQTELLLVFAARAAHMEQTVLPALREGKIVLCDRFVDSSHVYQGVLGGQDGQWIDALNQHSVTRQPDQVFIFDLPVSVAVERMQQRSHSDRFDRQSLDNLERLRAAYLTRAKLPSRCLIDATLAEDTLAQRLSNEIMSCMP